MRRLAMRRLAVLCVGVALAFAAQVRAQPAGLAELPQDVVVFAQITDATQLDRKVEDLIFQLDPGAVLPPPIDLALAESALGTDAPDTVDMSKPLQVVLLEPPLLGSPVLVFTVTDAGGYVASLGMEFEQAEGGLLVSQQPGRTVVFGAVEDRAAMGSDREAVRKVLAHIEAGALGEESLVAGDGAACVRLRRLLEALGEQGRDPFDVLLRNMPMAGPMMMGGPQNLRALEETVKGVRSLSMGVELLALSTSVSSQELLVRAHARPTPGSGLAAYVAGTPRGELGLLEYMPADAMAVGAYKLGDITPLFEWYGSLLAAMAGQDEAESEALAEVMDLVREFAAQIDGELAAAGVLSDEGTLRVVEAVRVKDPAALQQLMVGLPDRLAGIGDVFARMGFGMSLAVEPDVLSHNGHDITQWDLDMEFTAPPDTPVGAQMAAMQQRMMTAMYGEDLTGYSTFDGDVLLYAQGKGSLEALKAMLDGRAGSVGASEAMAPFLEGEPVAVGFLDLSEYLSFYLRLVGTAMQQPGAPRFFPFGGVQFPDAPPVTVRATITEDGAVQKEFRLPVATIRAIADGFRNAMMGGGQPPDVL